MFLFFLNFFIIDTQFLLSFKHLETVEINSHRPSLQKQNAVVLPGELIRLNIERGVGAAGDDSLRCE